MAENTVTNIFPLKNICYAEFELLNSYHTAMGENASTVTRFHISWLVLFFQVGIQGQKC